VTITITIIRSRTIRKNLIGSQLRDEMGNIFSKSNKPILNALKQGNGGEELRDGGETEYVVELKRMGFP